MKKNSTLIIMLLMYSINCYSQYKITGIVKDSITGKPIPGVAVYLENTFQVAVTRNNGSYELTGIPAGTHRIIAHLLSYSEYKNIITLPGISELDITIAPAPNIQNEVVITATRAGINDPMAVSDLSKEQIADNNTGRDIPYLLTSVPSVVVTSDAGTGIGYTGIRIRGSDPTRINVTIDGIPINDAESQGMYWVILPDLASSIESIQVQRGVGTSTNGAGSFGGSINIQTSNPQPTTFASSTAAIGSFNTLKNNIDFGTGLINDKWNFEGRLSKISSDGYVDRGSSDLKSFFFTGGYYGKKDFLKFNIFSGKEITYQSWYGVPEAALDTNRTWNYYTYDNQVDDYQQDNYQLFYSREILKNLHTTVAFHYTKGKGYYEEFENDQLLADYNLPDIEIGDTTIQNTDLIRRKWLNNDFYGTTFSVNYEPIKKLNIILGGAWNQYNGDHYDEVIWARYFSSGNIRHQYYNDNGLKTDFNIYLKSTLQLTNIFSVFTDLQYRNVIYRFHGFDEQLSFIPQKDNLNFFNPKIGLTCKIDPAQTAYASLSVGNKEPSRDDYTESSTGSRPKPETLYDIESGYYYRNGTFMAGANYFLMMYTNQLVLTGQINDVGNYTRTNVKESSRQGIEIELGWKPNKLFEFNANSTFSKNEIKDYFDYTDDYDQGTQVVTAYNNTDIAFSPNITSRVEGIYHPLKNMGLALSSRYVGEQFLDNTSNEQRKLNPFLVTDFRINYSLHPKFMKEITFTAMVNNLLDVKYESNGYTFSYIYGGEKTTENYYYPQAGRNFLIQLKLSF